MKERNYVKKIIIYFLSVLLILSLWTLIAKSINAPLILPSVNIVFNEIIKLVQTTSFWINFSFTILRVFIAFFISLILGLILGLLSGYSHSFKIFLEIPLSIVRSTPVVAIILITLFWIGSSKVPVFVAILMDLPIVVTSVTNAMEKNNKNLMFMATVYNLSVFQKFRFIKLNDLIPFLLNGAISVFGLSWKVVVAGEVLSIPKYGFGSLMQIAQVHLETATVIAITLILVITSFLLEKLLSAIVNKIIKRGFN